MTPKFHSLQVRDVRTETEDTVSVAFHVPSELSQAYHFIPGQYLTLRATIEGEDIRRSYSICAAPHENELRVAIKRVVNGKFSTWLVGNNFIQPNLRWSLKYRLLPSEKSIWTLVDLFGKIAKKSPFG